jgi:hypothetical protein
VNTPVYLSSDPTSANITTGRKLRNYDTVNVREHHENLNNSIRDERAMNERKRLFNREVGRTALVNQVFHWQSSKNNEVRERIFPQKATHVQVLAMTGNLKSGDAQKMPPLLPKGKRWLGDGQGWEH